MSLLLIGVGLILLSLSIWDWKYYQLPDLFLMILFGLMYLFLKLNGVSLSFIGGSILFCLATCLKFSYVPQRKVSLGWGDVKFLTICGFGIDLNNISLFLVGIGVFGLVTALFWRLKGWGPYFPLGPSISGSFGLIILMDTL